MSPASLPLKDESLDLLFARDDKEKIVMRRFLLTGSSLALSGEADIGRISGNQEDSSSESFSSFESSVEIEEIRALVDVEDYEGSLLERVRTDSKENNHVPFSSDSSSITGNQLPRQNACESGQLTEGSHEPHAATSSGRNLESQGTRPKRIQMQPPVNMPFWPSSRPVSDGLAKDFLARHSQDRATHGSLYTDDRDLPSLVPELLWDNSSVDGLTSASEAYNVSPYFGAMGASPYERLGGSVARVGLLGHGLNNESSCGSSAHATAAPSPSFTVQTHLSSVWSGMLSDGVNTSNRHLPPNDFETSGHSLTGEPDLGFLIDQNFCSSLQSVQHINSSISPNSRFVVGSSVQHINSPISPNSRFVFGSSVQHINSPISPNSRFVFGSTSSDFAAGIHPGYSMYGAQRHVLSDGNLALIVDQRSHHGNLNLESQSSQFGHREQAAVSFAANGIIVGILPWIVPSL